MNAEDRRLLRKMEAKLRRAKKHTAAALELAQVSYGYLRTLGNVDVRPLRAACDSLYAAYSRFPE